MVNEIQKYMVRQLMVIGRTVRGSKEPTLKETEESVSYVQCFSYLVSSSIDVSIFPITWRDTFWTDLVFFILCMYTIYLYIYNLYLYLFIYYVIYLCYI